MKWKPFIRATALSLLAGLGVVSMLLIVGFVVLPAEGLDAGGTTLETIVGTFGILLIALPFAVAVGLPLVIMIGGAMALAAQRWGVMRTWPAWAISGLLGASVTWLILGGPSRTIQTL